MEGDVAVGVVGGVVSGVVGSVVVPGAVEVPRGEGEIRLPLAAFASDQDPGDQLTFGNVSAGGGLERVELQGSDLVLAAAGESPPGTVTISYEVSDSKSPPVTGTVAARIVESKRPMPKAVEDSVADSTPGVAVSVPVLDNDFNPFADQGKPLKVISASVPGDFGSASADGSNVTFVPTANFTGFAQISYRIQDAGGRQADGTVVVPITAPPGAPSGVTGTPEPDGTSVTLSWQAPANNGSPITGYTVSGGTGSGCSTSATTCRVSGLKAGEPVAFTVAATNAKGTGPSSESASVTPDAAPSEPTGFTATALTDGSGTVNLSWGSPEIGSAKSYIVSGPGTITQSGTSATVTFGEGMQGDAESEWSVKAVNPEAPSGGLPATARATPTRPPNPPAEPDVSPGENYVTFTWSEGSGTGSRATGYEISVNGGDYVAASSPYEIPGVAGTTYSFSVKAINKFGPAGKGESAAVPGKKSVTFYTSPGTPTVTATASSTKAGIVDVTITAPTDTGGAPSLIYKCTTAKLADQPCTAGSNTVQAQFGDTSVTVTATNDKDSSKYSSVSNTITGTVWENPTGGAINTVTDDATGLTFTVSAVTMKGYGGTPYLVGLNAAADKLSDTTSTRFTIPCSTPGTPVTKVVQPVVTGSPHIVLPATEYPVASKTTLTAKCTPTTPAIP